MNPPLRSKDHYDRLWDAVDETLVSTIGSDHAPHTKEEKNRKYPLSPSGMPGVQTLLPVMPVSYTHLTLPTKRIV